MYTDLTAQSCGTGPGSFGYYERDAATFAAWDIDYLKVDFCGADVSRTDTDAQYAAWATFGAALRDATSAASRRPIYYSICPHAQIPPDASGVSAQYTAGGTQPFSAYAPPTAWNASARLALANSILVEFTNTFDLWYADTVPRGDGGPLPFPGGVITNLDAMLALTRLEDSQPGSWNDADMLQVCTYGEGATRHFPHQGMQLSE